MTASSHQGLYRSSPLILGGLLGSIVLLIAGVAVAWQIATSPSQRLPLVLGVLGVFVLTFFVCGLAALRRHRWTIDANAVLIEERPLVPLMGRRRVRRVPFGGIAALSNVQNGAEEVLALTTRDGERFALPPGRAPSGGQDLASFAARLQAAITAAGGVAPPVTDGLGFWNRPPGLALLSIALLASLAVAAVALWGLWQGAIVRVKTHEAAAALVVLPIGVGWLLRRCWQRRRSVMKAMR
jgi:hypothetical protein